MSISYAEIIFDLKFLNILVSEFWILKIYFKYDKFEYLY